MKGRLRSPPLNALRAFEAAARHLSFVAAADELFVTPGAISHQIASLESFLGLKLFVRGTRSITLTDSAKACLPQLTRGFETLREAVRSLAPETGIPPLTVTVPPGFASRWLLPRLATFTKRHPDIDLRFATGEGVVDVVRKDPAGPASEPDGDAGATDVSIRFGRGAYPGFDCEKLFDAEITAVCAPSLMASFGGGAEGLASMPLVHDDTVYFDDERSNWAVWLEAAGLEGLDTSKGSRFSHTGWALDAAEDGVGIALGITALTTERPRSRSLKGPVPFKLRSSFSYYLVYRRGMGRDSTLQAFRGWLMAEVGRGS